MIPEEQSNKENIIGLEANESDVLPPLFRKKPSSPLITRPRWSARLTPLLMGNLLIWGLALLLLQCMPKSYKSKGAISISSVNSQGKVFLPDAGEVSSDQISKSPFGYLTKVDPRENYRLIALSDPVLEKAAASFDLSVAEFGEPALNSAVGTTIIEFELEGSSPAEAKNKARVFYETLVDRVKYLRQSELVDQQKDTRVSFENAKREFQAAQEKFYTFTRRSPLKVINQINKLSEQLEGLRIERANIVAQNQSALARVQQVSKALNLSSEDANDALKLADDKVFQAYLQQYSDSTAALKTSSASLTSANPQVVEQRAEQAEAKTALLQRSSVLLGKSVGQTFLQKLTLNSDGQRQQVVADFLSQKAEQSSLNAKAQKLQQEIDRLTTRLQTLSQEQYTFDRLKQDVKLTESIFLAKLGQLNIDKPSYATSYPPLQLVVDPNLPKEYDIAARRTLILGVLALSLIGSTGFIVLWWNKSEEELIPENDFYIPESYEHPLGQESEQKLDSVDKDPLPKRETEIEGLIPGSVRDIHELDIERLEIEKLSLEQLESITQLLFQHWTYANQFIEEKEEERDAQRKIVKKIEKQIRSACHDHDEPRAEHLKTRLSREVERQHFIEESLEGQRSKLDKKHESLLQFQTALKQRQSDLLKPKVLKAETINYFM